MSKTNHSVMNSYARLLPVFAIAVAFVAIAGLIPAERADAAATSGSCGDGVAWSFEGDTLSITYTGTGTEGWTTMRNRRSSNTLRCGGA